MCQLVLYLTSKDIIEAKLAFQDSMTKLPLAQFRKQDQNSERGC